MGGLPYCPAPLRVVKCTPLPSLRGLNAGVLGAAAGAEVAVVLGCAFFVLSRLPRNLIKGTRPCSWVAVSALTGAFAAGAAVEGAGLEEGAAAAAVASTSISYRG